MPPWHPAEAELTSALRDLECHGQMGVVVEYASWDTERSMPMWDTPDLSARAQQDPPVSSLPWLPPHPFLGPLPQSWWSLWPLLHLWPQDLVKPPLRMSSRLGF